jgi:iron complex outermembrane receptor protein
MHSRGFLRVLLGTTLFVPALVSTTVIAQAQALPQAATAAPADETRAADQIIVTGSLIKGAKEAGALPIQVISSEDLAKQGAPTALEILKALPTSSGVLGDSNQFDARSQGSEGIASVNLRGLGPGRTLVLLNSRRLVAAGNGVPAVDINLIPQAAIGRVEVLKDGAAAIYGSDAVAGVVNFITRTNQNGFLASGDYKFVKGSTGDFNASLSFGRETTDFRFFAAAGYQHRGELMTIDRKFAIQPYTVNPQGGFTGGGNPATFLTLGPTGAPNSGLAADPDCALLGGYVTANLGRCSTQFSSYDALVETENRGQLFVDAEGRFSDTVKLRVNALVGYSEVPHYRTSPSYLLTQPPSPTIGLGASPSGFFVPANNPGFVQLQLDNPGKYPANSLGALFPTLLYRPYLIGGNPAFLANDRNGLGSATGFRSSFSYRVSGDLTWAVTSKLDFTLSATYHLYDRQTKGYDSFGDRVQLALRGLGGPSCDATTGIPGVGPCMFLNPFGNAIAVNPVTGQTNPGPVIPNSAELTKWFFVLSTNRTVTKLAVYEASLGGGSGIELPGGEVKFAIGAQYRDNRYSTSYGANNNLAVNPCRITPVTGSTACSPQNGALAFLGTNRDGTFANHVSALFAELQAPVFSTVDLQLAARYEKYSGTTGSTFDPKATVRWQALPFLAFRGSVGTTFRGPPPQILSPDSVTSLQVIGTSFRPVDVFGNPALTPERALNYSFGAIVQQSGFTASVDYFHYRLRGGIVAEPLVGMVNTLFANAANCTDPAYAALRQRFTFNDGGGVPGAGTCSIAAISRVRTAYLNGAQITNSGLDFQLDYHGQLAGGRLGAGVAATRVLHFQTADQPVAGVIVQPAFDGVGLLNYQTTAYPLPKWKGTAFLEFSRSIATGRLTYTYIDRYTDQRTTIFAPDPTIAGSPALTQGKTIRSFQTLDFNLQLRPFGTTTINFTVLNVFDRDPSFARLDYNYDPFTSNPLGRQFKIGISQAF